MRCAASAAGFERVKLNCVVMKGRNFDEVPALVQYAITLESRGLLDLREVELYETR